MTAPDVSVVAVSWNTAGCLPDALDAVPAACGDRSWEIVVVDNGSTDGSPELLRSRGDTRVVALDRNTGFTHAANVGLREAAGRYVLFLNPDAVADPGAVDALVGALEVDPRAWGATPRFRNPDGSPQHFWIRFPDAVGLALGFTRWGRSIDRLLGGRSRRRRYYVDLEAAGGVHRIDAAGAAFLLVRRDELLHDGGFDERYLNFFQDGDHARRMARAGRYLLGVGSATVTHEAGVTIRRLPSVEREGQYLYAYRQYLAGEPRLRRLVGEAAVRADVLLARRDRRELRARALRPVGSA